MDCEAHGTVSVQGHINIHTGSKAVTDFNGMPSKAHYQKELRLEGHEPGQTYWLPGPDWPCHTLHRGPSLLRLLIGLVIRLHNWESICS